MSNKTWIIVANSSQARFFKLHNLALVEQAALIHPEARLLDQDFVSDRPGRAYDSMGSGRHGMESKTTPKKNEATLFAKQIADHLDNARATGQVSRLFVAASPSFLGLLRKEMTLPTAGLIAASVDKDVTHLTPEEIKTYFPIGL